MGVCTMYDFNFSMVHLFEMVSGGEFNAYNVYLGNQFGIYQAMEESGPVSTLELSLTTGLRESHLEPWLQSQVEDGFITRSASTHGIRYRLDRRIAAVIQDRVAVDRFMRELLPTVRKSGQVTSFPVPQQLQRAA